MLDRKYGPDPDLADGLPADIGVGSLGARDHGLADYLQFLPDFGVVALADTKHNFAAFLGEDLPAHNPAVIQRLGTGEGERRRSQQGCGQHEEPQNDGQRVDERDDIGVFIGGYLLSRAALRLVRDSG